MPIARCVLARVAMSERERQARIFLQRYEGCLRAASTSQIAEQLQISLNTIQAYGVRAKEKLRLNTATQLLREAIFGGGAFTLQIKLKSLL